MNLLQPQDRRSPEPGDSRLAVDGRAALEAHGIGTSVAEAAAAEIAALNLPAGAVVVDLGCGTGYAVAAIAAATPLTTVGIDLSAAAIAHAARRSSSATWVVANADRRLPLLDGSVAVVLSLHGRRNPAEAARVLEPSGLLLMAVPSPDDLVELREEVQGQPLARDRVAALIEEHAPGFTLASQTTVRHRHTLERDDLLALLAATYRGARQSAASRVAALSALEVTFASDLCRFTKVKT